MSLLYACFCFLSFLIFVGCDTNSVNDIPFSHPYQFNDELLKIMRDISSKLKIISEKIDTSDLYLTLSNEIDIMKKQHELLKQDFEVSLRDAVSEKNRTDGLFMQNREELSRLQQFTQNIQTSTTRIFSEVYKDLSTKITKLEQQTNEYETFANSSFEKVTFEVGSLNSSLSKIIGCSCNANSSTDSNEVSLWVSTVKGFSSQYNTGSWAAKQVIGAPNVYPAYGDRINTWAQASDQFTANQYIEVGYAERLFLKEVHIYETYNAGGVKEIKALSPYGRWETIWRTQQVQRIQSSRIFSPPIKRTNYPTDLLHIVVDCMRARSYVEIDAIKVIGTRTNDSN